MFPFPTVTPRTSKNSSSPCSTLLKYVEESNIMRETFLNQPRQRGEREDLLPRGFLRQPKLQIAAELSSWPSFAPTDSHSSARSEGEKARACEEETQSESMPGETRMRRKEERACLFVSERAAVERGMCETERESR